MELYPFVRVRGRAGAARLHAMAVGLSKMPGHDAGVVFVGLADSAGEDALVRMYQEPVEGSRLPPLFLVNSGAFLLHKAGRGNEVILRASERDAAVAVGARLVDLDG